MKLTSLQISDTARLTSIKSLINTAHLSNRSVLLTIVGYHYAFGKKEMFPTLCMDNRFLDMHQEGIVALEIASKPGHFVDFDFENMRVKGEIPIAAESKLAQFDVPVQAISSIAIEDTEDTSGAGQYFILSSSFLPYLPSKFINFIPENTTLN